MQTSARHETRALLRAHLSAAVRYRHATRRCAVCHRLLLLALEPQDPGTTSPGRRRGGPRRASTRNRATRHPRRA
ncbi:DUF6274 family protein [Streptomyces sp. M19]